MNKTILYAMTALLFVSVAAAYPTVVVSAQNQALYAPRPVVQYTQSSPLLTHDYVSSGSAERIYDNGYDDGYEDGYDDGFDEGYDQGYDDGRDDDYGHRDYRHSNSPYLDDGRCRTYSYWYDPSCPERSSTRNIIYVESNGMRYFPGSYQPYGTPYRTMVVVPTVDYYNRVTRY